MGEDRSTRLCRALEKVLSRTKNHTERTEDILKDQPKAPPEPIECHYDIHELAQNVPLDVWGDDNPDLTKFSREHSKNVALPPPSDISFESRLRNILKDKIQFRPDKVLVDDAGNVLITYWGIPAFYLKKL